MFYFHVKRLVVVMLGLFYITNVQSGAYSFSGETYGVDIVTHPSNYTGASTGTLETVTVRVCIDPTSPNAADMEYSIINNIAAFNQLVPTQGNVQLNSNNNIPTNFFDFESVALHEMGHCLGMAHVNAASESNLPSAQQNYTKATDGTNSFDLDAGADGVIGSSDDIRGDDVNLVWFRKFNNDPFTIEAVIDSTTYSQDVADLPNGHSFAANADRSVSTLLGYTMTESIMQQGTFSDEAQRTLSHDDVATLSYAKSGLDERESGGNNARDNYNLKLEYGGISVTDQFETCDISVSMTSMAGLAACSVSASNFSPTSHFVVTSATMQFGDSYNWFFNAEVANAPVLAAIGSQSLTEGDVLVVPLSATDTDGDDIVYSSSGLPSFASLVDNGDGTADLTLLPVLGDAVSTSMTITVTDDSTSALSDDETFNITVANLEVAPVLNAIGNQLLVEGDVLVIPLSATDADGDGIVYNSSGLPSFASLVDNGDGTADLTLSPTFGDAVATSMTISVTDDSISTLSDDETFNITVAVLEVAPVLNAIGNQTLTEGDVLVIPLSATDVNGDSITYSSSGLPSFASLVDNGDGTADLTLSPTLGDAVLTSMTITVVDNSVLTITDDETFNITVANLEVAPVLNAIGNQQLVEGDVLVIPLSATDGDGDGITYSSSGLPLFASLVDNGDGTADLTLSPTLGDAVSTLMTITVTDDSASALTDDETFNIDVSDGVSTVGVPVLPILAYWLLCMFVVITAGLHLRKAR